MIEIPSKRGWLVRLHEPRVKPTEETMRHYYNTVIDCLIEIEKEQKDKEKQNEKKEATS